MDRFDFGEKQEQRRIRKAPDLNQARERLKAVSPPPISRDINRPEWAEALYEAGWICEHRLHTRIWARNSNSPWYAEPVAYKIATGKEPELESSE